MNIILGAAAGYGIMIGGLYFLQDKLIFPRHATSEPQHQLPEGATTVQLASVDDHPLVGHLIRRPGQRRDLVVGFTGNAWNAADCFTFIARRLPDVDVAVFHYRGYRPSGGHPSQDALFADALLIHDHLKATLEPERVFALGFSLGSGVAAYLTSRRPIAGQILVTPFDSIEAIAQARYKIVPVGLLLKHPFRSIEHLRGLDVPTAVIAAADDNVVPPARTAMLVASLRRLVMYETLTGASHGGIYDLTSIDGLLRDALERVAAPIAE